MANVDVEVEPLVRAGFAAAVQRQPETFEQALRGIPPERAEEALRLAFAVDAYVVRSIFAGEPTGEDLDELAAEFVSMEDWYPASELPAETFFRMLGGADHQPLPNDPGKFSLLCLLAGAWLLSAFLDDEKNWFEYLDEVLNALDAEPASQ